MSQRSGRDESAAGRSQDNRNSPGDDGATLERRHVFWLASESDLQALVGGLRRLLQAHQCDSLEQARIITAASELGHNILRYADRGHIAVALGMRHGRAFCELSAVDQGPGIANIEDALTDHFSSGTGLGLGLPGVRRLVDDFEITSIPGQGTRVVARRWWRP